MEKKYELLQDDTLIFRGKTLHRIKALRDFSNILKGCIGGYIEKEENLSHEGNCWVYDNAKVFDDAMVSDNAHIHNYAEVYDKAEVSGNAIIFDKARVFGNAKVADRTIVYSFATVADNAEVSGNSRILGSALIHENAKLNDSTVSGYASIGGYTEMHNCKINSATDISGDAIIGSESDYCSISISGYDKKAITFFKCKDGSIKVKNGSKCRCDTLDEFRAKAKENHENDEYAEIYLAFADIAEAKILNKKGE